MGVERNYLSAFQFYDKNNHRLSIFGKKVGDILEITIIPCTTKSQFIKNRGIQIYENIKEDDSHYETHNVVIMNSSPQSTFIDWCNSRYARLPSVVFD